MPANLIRLHAVIRGTVQGVGFRPHVYRLAIEHGVSGWVANTSEGVILEAEATDGSVEAFLNDISAKAPPLAVIDEVESREIPATGDRDFVIRASQPEPGQFVPISPDVGTCGDCRRELFDPTDRRYLYPFTNCTNCGPRYTIVQDIPYDRPLTTMGVFPMCPDCEREYHDPTDRRFHAQPNACPVCGPTVWLEDLEGVVVAGRAPEADGVSARRAPDVSTRQLRGTAAPALDTGSPAAFREAARLIAEGAVLAIRGIGGFHLACDATNDDATRTLRERKHRVDKPFAIMSPDIETIEAYCEVSDSERQLLGSPARPIVLLTRRGDAAVAQAISPTMAPNNHNLGIMLPYSPLHYLLLDELRRLRPAPVALVLTSGNLSEEPIATGNAEALDRLRGLADYFLLHNREIHMRCDDSVARVFRGRPTLLRRSRGYAPAPVRLRHPVPQILAAGAELKNTFGLARDQYAFLSQHIGDLENHETLESYRAAIAHFERIFRVTPGAIAYDLHPDYLASRYALERLEENPALVGIGVQHHQAHIASCMLEHSLEGEVIGVAFDGTGFGLDRAIWGGEVFMGGYAGFERLAHLGYVRLPGGDAAIRRPLRIALSYILSAYGPDGLDLPLPVRARALPGELNAVRRLVETGLNSPPTSSAGRLFDAVAAILDVRDSVNYEGQAAIELEMLADGTVQDAYDWPLATGEDGSLLAEPAEVIRRVVADHLAGVPRETISARFHNAVAALVARMCEEARSACGLDRVCLSGGVFQNALLLGRTIDALERAGFTAYTQRLVPPNDGGIALGQIAMAAAALR